MSHPAAPSYIRYLASKKALDDRSLNRQVWDHLVQAVRGRSASTPLQVLEVGCGIGTMLERLLDWGLLTRAAYTGIDVEVEFIQEARRRCWFVDSQGLVVRGRPGKLAEHKEPYAQAAAPCSTLAEAVEAFHPTVLVGVSGQARAFTREIVTRLATFNRHPVIFALSNPTSKAECTAEDAYQWTEGRAIFASGSPYPPVTIGGRTLVPGQCNNVYVFPGIGLGAVACEASRITDGMFLTTARTLAAQVTEPDLAAGRIFPALAGIRGVSLKIAAAVADEAHREGLARLPRPADLEADVRARMFMPDYQDYV